jgi:hypothetical protein
LPAVFEATVFKHSKAGHLVPHAVSPIGHVPEDDDEDPEADEEPAFDMMAAGPLQPSGSATPSARTDRETTAPLYYEISWVCARSSDRTQRKHHTLSSRV